MSEIKINNIPVITENNGSVSLTTGTIDANGIILISGNQRALRFEKNDGTLDNIIYYNNGTSANKLSIGRDSSVLALRTDGIERMSIDSSGHVTMPYQPSFNAYLSTGQAIAAGTWTKVNLNTTQWNVGSHFNTSTYRFTAPVDGIYFLSYTVQFPTGINGYLYTGLKVNGTFIHYGNGLKVDAFISDNTLGHGTSYKLNTNDYVELWAYHGGGETLGSGVTRTHMNGILLG